MRENKEGQLLRSRRFNLDSGGTDFREACHALGKGSISLLRSAAEKAKEL